jgi:hypothetical protein
MAVSFAGSSVKTEWSVGPGRTLALLPTLKRRTGGRLPGIRSVAERARDDEILPKRSRIPGFTAFAWHGEVKPGRPLVPVVLFGREPFDGCADVDLWYVG